MSTFEVLVFLHFSSQIVNFFALMTTFVCIYIDINTLRPICDQREQRNKGATISYGNLNSYLGKHISQLSVQVLNKAVTMSS